MDARRSLVVPGETPTLRLVSFNMRAGGSLSHWQEMIDRLAPDIALVQETRDPRNFAAELGIPRGRLVWAPVEHGKWGSALLLPRRPRALLPVPGFDGWVVGAVVTAWPRRPPWHVYSVHVPARRRSYVREANAMLDGIAAQSAGGDLVIGGDFNLTVAHRAPGEERANSRGEQRFLERTEVELGLANAWRAIHPGVPLTQTLRWTRDPVTAYHCDEILVPKSWAACLRSAEVSTGEPWERLSDHNPVTVDLMSRSGRRHTTTRCSSSAFRQ